MTRRFETDENLRVVQADVLFKELGNDLLRDLASAWFLMIPSERRSLYEQRQPLFGPLVDLAFPEANDDIAGAG